MRTCIVFVCAFLLSWAAACQNIDSLKRLLSDANNETEANLYFRVAAAYYSHGQLDSATYYSKVGFDRAARRNDSVAMAKMGRILAMMLRSLGEPDSAIEVCRRVLPIAEQRDMKEEKYILHTLGVCLTFKGDYHEALAIQFRSLVRRQRDGDTAEIAVALNGVGFVHYKLSNYPQALKDFHACLRLLNRMEDSNGASMLRISIGLCHAYLGAVDSARYYVDLVRNACGDECAERVVMHSDFAYGVIAAFEDQNLVAKTHFEKSFRIAKSLGDVRMQLDNIEFLAEILLKEDSPRAAIAWLEVAETAIGNSSPFKLELTKIYTRLYEAHRALGDLERVVLYQEKYIAVRDSTYNEELANGLAKVEANYLERGNRAQLALQAEVIELNERIMESQRNKNIMTSGLAIALIIAIVLLVMAFRRKRRANVLLDARVRERTAELEANRNSLWRQYRELELAADRSSREMRNRLMTSLGLCALGQTGLRDPKTIQCLSELERALTEMLNSLEQRQSNDLMIMNEKEVGDGGR